MSGAVSVSEGLTTQWGVIVPEGERQRHVGGSAFCRGGNQVPPAE